MTPIEKLAKLFSEFPGIGERQSKRFAYFLLSKNSDYADELLNAIKNARQNVRQCSSCFRYFESKNGAVCDICINDIYDKSMLMVVEKDADFESINRSKQYKGKFFILGGLIPIVEKSTPARVRINELLKKIEREASAGTLKEIILAFSLSREGDHTDSYVRELLNNIVEKYSIKLDSLGRGLSTGTELEYSDADTIKYALKNRQ
jgi:recombination protein RecR